jgi:hypothetical protein
MKMQEERQKNRSAVQNAGMHPGFEFVAAGLALPGGSANRVFDPQPILRYTLFATRTPHLCIS